LKVFALATLIHWVIREAGIRLPSLFPTGLAVPISNRKPLGWPIGAFRRCYDPALLADIVVQQVPLIFVNQSMFSWAPLIRGSFQRTPPTIQLNGAR
jgi:hypothetical protein